MGICIIEIMKDTSSMKSNKNVTENSRARRARREAEKKGARLTICICAVLFLALCAMVAVLLRSLADADASVPASGNGVAAPVVAASATPAAHMQTAPVPSATPRPTASEIAPTPSATPLDAQPAASATAPAPSAAPAGNAEVPTFETEEELSQISILITAAGDCTLGGDVNSGSTRFDRYAQQYGMDYFLANVRAIFEEDDFTFVNLEGPLTTSTDKRSGRQFNFRGSPEYVQILSGSSVEVCSLANNHALDFKTQGLQDTAENLRNAGIGAAGYENAYYAEKDGVRLCFLSFTEWDASAADYAARVQQERENCDLLIVSMHWGEELRHAATSEQVAYGHALIDAGADLVLGHHSHVVGGIERYKGKYIVYSLGNFCFGGNRNPDDKNTFIFQQEFVVDAGGQLADGGINIIPCSISSESSSNNYQPTPLQGEAALSVIQEISSYSSVDGEILWLDGYIGQT